MENKTISEVCEDAAIILDERGLTKGWYENTQTGEVCMLGALKYAAGGNVNWSETDERLVSILKFLRENLGLDFPHDWNDQPERTKEQVQDKLIETAKYFRNQGK